MVRSTFARIADAPVDLIGSSSALDDELFVNQIDGFFNNSCYDYNVIFVQMGHHGRVGKTGEEYAEHDFEKFENDLKCLLAYLRQHCANIVLETVFSSVIPQKINKLERRLFGRRLHRALFKAGVRREVPDEEINRVTDRKNEIIRKVAGASASGVTLLDIDEIVKKKRFMHTDHIHFENEAKLFIAKRMLEAVDAIRCGQG